MTPGSASGNINRRRHLRSRQTIMNAGASITPFALGVAYPKQSQDEITLMHSGSTTHPCITMKYPRQSQVEEATNAGGSIISYAL